MLSASFTTQEKDFDVVCLLPQPRRKLLLSATFFLPFTDILGLADPLAAGQVTETQHGHSGKMRLGRVGPVI